MQLKVGLIGMNGYGVDVERMMVFVNIGLLAAGHLFMVLYIKCIVLPFEARKSDIAKHNKEVIKTSSVNRPQTLQSY